MLDPSYSNFHPYTGLSVEDIPDTRSLSAKIYDTLKGGHQNGYKANCYLKEIAPPAIENLTGFESLKKRCKMLLKSSDETSSELANFDLPSLNGGLAELPETGLIGLLQCGKAIATVSTAASKGIEHLAAPSACPEIVLHEIKEDLLSAGDNILIGSLNSAAAAVDTTVSVLDVLGELSVATAEAAAGAISATGVGSLLTTAAAVYLGVGAALDISKNVALNSKLNRLQSHLKNKPEALEIALKISKEYQKLMADGIEDSFEGRETESILKEHLTGLLRTLDNDAINSIQDIATVINRQHLLGRWISYSSRKLKDSSLIRSLTLAQAAIITSTTVTGLVLDSTGFGLAAGVSVSLGGAALGFGVKYGGIIGYSAYKSNRRLRHQKQAYKKLSIENQEALDQLIELKKTQTIVTYKLNKLAKKSKKNISNISGEEFKQKYGDKITNLTHELVRTEKQLSELHKKFNENDFQVHLYDTTSRMINLIVHALKLEQNARTPLPETFQKKQGPSLVGASVTETVMPILMPKHMKLKKEGVNPYEMAREHFLKKPSHYWSKAYNA